MPVPIWFVVRSSPHTAVIYRYRDAFPGYAEVQKKLFREYGTPVIAVVRLKTKNFDREAGEE